MKGEKVEKLKYAQFIFIFILHTPWSFLSPLFNGVVSLLRVLYVFKFSLLLKTFQQVI